MSSAFYIVRPLPTGLYELTGPTLPFPQLYVEDSAALNYAHFAGRGQIGKAVVLSRSGAVLFCERLAGPTFFYNRTDPHALAIIGRRGRPWMSLGGIVCGAWIYGPRLCIEMR